MHNKILVNSLLTACAGCANESPVLRLHSITQYNRYKWFCTRNEPHLHVRQNWHTTFHMQGINLAVCQYLPLTFNWKKAFIYRYITSTNIRYSYLRKC